MKKKLKDNSTIELKKGKDWFLQGIEKKNLKRVTDYENSSSRKKVKTKNKKSNYERSLLESDHPLSEIQENARQVRDRKPHVLSKLQQLEGVDLVIGRQKKLHPKWKDWFFYELQLTGSIRRACIKANVSRIYVDRIRKEDPDFEKCVQVAKADFNDLVEEEIDRRGRVGYEEELVYKGYKTGQRIRKYSDFLLHALAQANNPKYKSAAQTNINVNIAERQVVLGFDDKGDIYNPD